MPGFKKKKKKKVHADKKKQNLTFHSNKWSQWFFKTSGEKWPNGKNARKQDHKNEKSINSKIFLCNPVSQAHSVLCFIS